MKNSIFDNQINSDTLNQQDQKNLVAKNCTKTQSEIIAELSDPKLSGAFLNSVSSSFKSEQEGRVTAVVAKAKSKVPQSAQKQPPPEIRTLCRESPQ